MLDTWPLVSNVAGLCLTSLGVILLFFFGMPYRLRTGGHTVRVQLPLDQQAARAERRFGIYGWIGLVFILIGTVLQVNAGRSSLEVARVGGSGRPGTPRVICLRWL
jgi:hypothetical protein